jgi:hypothetical protein
LCRWSLLFASKRWKIIKACQAVASRFWIRLGLLSLLWFFFGFRLSFALVVFFRAGLWAWYIWAGLLGWIFASKSY